MYQSGMAEPSTPQTPAGGLDWKLQKPPADQQPAAQGKHTVPGSRASASPLFKPFAPDSITLLPLGIACLPGNSEQLIKISNKAPSDAPSDQCVACLSVSPLSAPSLSLGFKGLYQSVPPPFSGLYRFHLTASTYSSCLTTLCACVTKLLLFVFVCVCLCVCLFECVCACVCVLNWVNAGLLSSKGKAHRELFHSLCLLIPCNKITHLLPD